MTSPLPSLALLLCLALPTSATIQSIGVYSTPAKAAIHPADLSAFLAGYLGNDKNYAVRNLDLFYLGSESAALVKARVLGNIIATRRTNAHVIVHEIAHVLGAIHLREKGAIMRPALEQYRLGDLFQVLPPIRFSPLNHRIIAITRTLPLGVDLAGHFDKVTQLLAVYKELQPTHPEAVAPYYGDLLLNAGRTTEAIDIFAQALEAAPQHRTLRPLLAEALEQAGRYREAQALIQQEFDNIQALLKRQTGGALQLKIHPTLGLSASMLSFGQVPIGYKRKMQLTLSNLGTAPLAIQRFGTPKTPFSLNQSPSPNTTIDPGESHTLQLIFQPEEAKSYLTSIEIHSNAHKQHIAVVRLSGTGAE